MTTSPADRTRYAAILRDLINGKIEHDEAVKMIPYDEVDKDISFFIDELVHYTFVKGIGIDPKRSLYWDGIEEQLLRDIHYIEHPEERPPPQEKSEYDGILMFLIPVLVVIGAFYWLFRVIFCAAISFVKHLFRKQG